MHFMGTLKPFPLRKEQAMAIENMQEEDYNRKKGHSNQYNPFFAMSCKAKSVINLVLKRRLTILTAKIQLSYIDI